MKYRRIRGLGIDAQIAHHHRLKEEPRVPEIRQQFRHVGTKRRHRQRRIHEHALRRGPQLRFRPKMGVPRRKILDDVQPLQSRVILGRRPPVHRPLSATGIRGHGLQARLSSHMPRQRRHHPTHQMWIPSTPADQLNINLAYLVKVSTIEKSRILRGDIHGARPPADHETLDNVNHAQISSRTRPKTRPHQRRQRHYPGGMPGLVQRHRTHLQHSDTTRPRVPVDIVVGNRRPRQNELSRQRPTLIHGVPDKVPQVRNNLPLIDQSRRLADECLLGKDLCHRAGAQILIQTHRARRMLKGSGGLATGLGALNEYGTHHSQVAVQEAIEDTGPINTVTAGHGRHANTNPQLVGFLTRNLWNPPPLRRAVSAAATRVAACGPARRGSRGRRRRGAPRRR